jgi:hypothetical protein
MVYFNEDIQSPHRSDIDDGEVVMVTSMHSLEDTPEESFVPGDVIESGGGHQSPIDVSVELGSALMAANVLISTPSLSVAGNDVMSVLPRRIMGLSVDERLRWGNEGDECIICMEPMANEEEVTDFVPCGHRYFPSLQLPYHDQ